MIWLIAQNKYSLLLITSRESHWESTLSSCPIDKSRNLQQGEFSGRLSKLHTTYTLQLMLCIVISNLTIYCSRRVQGWSSWSTSALVCWWLNKDRDLKSSVVRLVTWRQKSLVNLTMKVCLLTYGLWEFYCMWCWQELSRSEALVSKTCTRGSKEGNTVATRVWTTVQPK